MTGRRFTLAVVIRKGNTYLGIAECSEGDQFSRKIGRKLSESRAIHKPARQYFNDDSEDIKKKAIKLLHEIRREMEVKPESAGPEIGDFVFMVHEIEKLRRKGDCTMNTLVTKIMEKFDFTVIEKVL